jgi:hypothetical protein
MMAAPSTKSAKRNEPMRDGPPGRDDDGDDGRVGYGRPPKSHQFKAGHSPHNKGKAPSQAVAAKLEEALRAARVVDRGGRKYTMSRLERMFRSAIDGACNGDASAIARVLRLMDKYDVPHETCETRIFIDGVAARLC